MGGESRSKEGGRVCCPHLRGRRPAVHPCGQRLAARAGAYRQRRWAVPRHHRRLHRSRQPLAPRASRQGHVLRQHCRERRRDMGPLPRVLPPRLGELRVGVHRPGRDLPRLRPIRSRHLQPQRCGTAVEVGRRGRRPAHQQAGPLPNVYPADSHDHPRPAHHLPAVLCRGARSRQPRPILGPSTRPSPSPRCSCQARWPTAWAGRRS